MLPEDIAAWKDTGHWHEAFCTGDIIPTCQERPGRPKGAHHV